MYSFPVFSVHFCELILAELDNYERSDITKHRPNTMNRFGVSQCLDDVHTATLICMGLSMHIIL